MKKGFTLIELLAVIVILAIIALIATPIVLDVINDAKQSTTLRSVEYYLDAVEQSIMKKNIDEDVGFNPNTCIVQPKGILLCDNKHTLEVEVNGEKPDNGRIVFENGKIENILLSLRNQTVVKNEKGELVYYVSPCTLISGDKNTAGSKYECEVKEGIKYTFYVLSQESDGTTNLIMDRNMCSDGTATNANKSDNCLVAYNETGDALGAGPITAMTYLNEATSTWDNIQNLNILYNDEGENFTNFKITGKARLPYLNEVRTYDGTNGYLYNNLHIACYNDDLEPTSCEVATRKYGVFEEGIEHIDKIWGYWTLSSSFENSRSAWNVDYNSSLRHDDDIVGVNNDIGVRPVINVKL